jgi:peptidoglycan/xylan/chitin deacetylase (PgdA/CDA1 family)
MYHYIRNVDQGSDPMGYDLSVTPDDFAAQIQYLAKAGYTSLTMTELEEVRARRAPLPPKPIVLTFDDGYRDFYTNAWPVLRQYGFKATTFIITGVVGQQQYMTWDMIAELDGSGQIEVASHTVSHKDLPGLSDATARGEIFNSKQALEERLGHPVTSFCYPAGHYSSRDAALVRQAGYTIAVTTQGGWSQAGQDAVLLPRVRVVGPRAIGQIRANFS